MFGHGSTHAEVERLLIKKMFNSDYAGMISVHTIPKQTTGEPHAMLFLNRIYCQTMCNTVMTSSLSTFPRPWIITYSYLFVGFQVKAASEFPELLNSSLSTEALVFYTESFSAAWLFLLIINWSSRYDSE